MSSRYPRVMIRLRRSFAEIICGSIFASYFFVIPNRSHTHFLCNHTNFCFRRKNFSKKCNLLGANGVYVSEGVCSFTQTTTNREVSCNEANKLSLHQNNFTSQLSSHLSFIKAYRETYMHMTLQC